VGGGVGVGFCFLVGGGGGGGGGGVARWLVADELVAPRLVDRVGVSEEMWVGGWVCLRRCGWVLEGAHVTWFRVRECVSLAGREGVCIKKKCGWVGGHVSVYLTEAIYLRANTSTGTGCERVCVLQGGRVYVSGATWQSGWACLKVFEGTHVTCCRVGVCVCLVGQESVLVGAYGV